MDLSEQSSLSLIFGNERLLTTRQSVSFALRVTNRKTRKPPRIKGLIDFLLAEFDQARRVCRSGSIDGRRCRLTRLAIRCAFRYSFSAVFESP